VITDRLRSRNLHPINIARSIAAWALLWHNTSWRAPLSHSDGAPVDTIPTDSDRQPIQPIPYIKGVNSERPECDDKTPL